MATNDIVVTFPGGLRVDAQVGEHLIRTDQPATSGGEGSAPAPFDVFLASIATCAGIYALGYCRARGLATDGLRVVQHTDVDEATKLPSTITLRLSLPEGFPEHHRAAIQRAMAGCKVKKTMAAAPSVVIALEEPTAAAAA